MYNTSPEVITTISSDQVVVFGSNESGKHLGGAARQAYKCWGAAYGQGFGQAGSTFAIPTMDWELNQLTLAAVSFYVQRFLRYTVVYPDTTFLVTRIGCGIAGFKDEQIAPLFKDCPSNVHLPAAWVKILS